MVCKVLNQIGGTMFFNRYFTMHLFVNYSLLILFLLFANNISGAVKYVLKDRPAGFFSLFNSVLGALDNYEASREFVGFEVNFGNRGYYYDKIRGENWWQYYFEPIKISKGNFDNMAVQELPQNQSCRFSIFAQFDMSRKRANELINKYIRTKPHVQKRIDLFVENNFKNYTVIGVHYRGTDKVSEAPVVPYERVYNTIKKDVVNIKNTKIFIATDDEYFLNFMKIKFGEQVICLDATRSLNGAALHTSQQYDKYNLGEDAIVDCVLLSKCNKLYKTASNLSDTSVKFNPDMPFVNLSNNYGR